MGPLIFSMALPAMISMIINALYNIVDSIFVAKYSQDALAAVSLLYPLKMLVVAIGVGTGVGVSARSTRTRRQSTVLRWRLLAASHSSSSAGDFRVYSSAHSVRARRFRLTLSSIRTLRSA